MTWQKKLSVWKQRAGKKQGPQAMPERMPERCKLRQPSIAWGSITTCFGNLGLPSAWAIMIKDADQMKPTSK